MIFYPHLYVGESVRHPEKVRKGLQKGSLFVNAYVIAFAPGDDLLEIYHARTFAQPFYRRLDRPIVALAGNYEEAVTLVQQILEETLAHTGGTDIKTYLLQKEQ